MAFNVNGTRPRIRAADLTPVAREAPYLGVFLKGIIIIVEIQPSIHAVLYGNGVVLKDRDGAERDTFTLIKDRLFETLTATIIAEV